MVQSCNGFLKSVECVSNLCQLKYNTGFILKYMNDRFDCRLHMKTLTTLCRPRWKVHSSGMDAPPRGDGGVPRPARPCGEGRFLAPQRKNDHNRREVAGQNKGHILKFHL